MADPYHGDERRKFTPEWSALTLQLTALHTDVGDIKSSMADFKEGMKELSQAILKLAVVEERQVQSAQSLERAFKLMEKLDAKIDGVATRVAELEKADQNQSRTSAWVDRSVWAAATAAVVYVAAKSGLIK